MKHRRIQETEDRNCESLSRAGGIMSLLCLPYNPKLKERARELRKHMTNAENYIWNNLLKKLPFRVLRQKPIDNFIVDFYCAKLKLVIEIDGDEHFAESGIEYDRERTAILESYGLNVIRFNNDEVIQSFEKIRDVILSLVKNPP